jgi:hypothetical protein
MFDIPSLLDGVEVGFNVARLTIRGAPPMGVSGPTRHSEWGLD